MVAKRPGGAVIASRTYTYTNSSGADTALRQTVTDQTGATTSYGYDALNRLTSATTGSTTLGYAYDADGNLTSASKTGAPTTYYGYNNANELCWAGPTSGSNGSSSCPATPAWDSAYTYDGDGNRLTGGGITAIYNNFNQTASVTVGGASTGMTYADIGSSLRTQVGTESVENTPLGVSRVSTASGSQGFTRDPNGNLISLRNNNTSSYYVLDALGSVLALTDSTGNTDTASYTYDPYGNTTSSAGSQTGINPFGYASGYTDQQTGQVHFGQRYYQPGVASWTQLDSLSQINSPIEADRYVYAGDNPISLEDLSGECVLGLFGSHCHIYSAASHIFTVATNAIACYIGADFGSALGAAASSESGPGIVVGTVVGGVLGCSAGIAFFQGVSPNPSLY